MMVGWVGSAGGFGEVENSSWIQGFGEGEEVGSGTSAKGSSGTRGRGSSETRGSKGDEENKEKKTKHRSHGRVRVART